MLLRQYSIKRPNHHGANTLSPKGLKKPTYIKFKADNQKNTKSGRSLYSVQTQRQSSSLTSRRMLSHRKLISLSSLEHRQNLTDRKLPNSLRQNKFTISSQDAPKHSSSNQPKQPSTSTLKPNPQQQPTSSLMTLFKRKADRLYTIQDIEGKQQNLQKALEIKENILKQFIERFQQQLREISVQKSQSTTIATKTLVANRNFKNKSTTTVSKQQPTASKKNNSHKNIITATACSLNSHGSTMNLVTSISNKQNIPLSTHEQMSEKNKFEVYIKQMQEHRKKEQKIFIMKNHKRSLQSISVSKIVDAEVGLTNNRVEKGKLQQRNNNKMNLKQLFRHSKKYQPYLRQGSTLALNPQPKTQPPTIPQQQPNPNPCSSLIQPPSFSPPIPNIQFIQPNNHGYADCSSIEKMNQSSFISQVGRRSLLKHLEKQSAKLTRQESRKSKKCLMKMKSVFPVDFF